MIAFADFAIDHPMLAIAAAAVAVAVLAALVSAICWGIANLLDSIDNRLEARRGIRHLESFANHPAHRTRKEDRP